MKKIISMLLVLTIVVTTLVGVMVVDVNAGVIPEVDNGKTPRVWTLNYTSATGSEAKQIMATGKYILVPETKAADGEDFYNLGEITSETVFGMDSYHFNFDETVTFRSGTAGLNNSYTRLQSTYSDAGKDDDAPSTDNRFGTESGSLTLKKSDDNFAGKVIGGDGGLTVGHEDHDGHTLTACLDAFSHGLVRRKQHLHAGVDTVLSEGTGVVNILGAVGLTIGCFHAAANTDAPAAIVAATGGIIFYIVAVSVGRIAVQGHEDNGPTFTGIHHNAHPVVPVLGIQGLDGVVGGNGQVVNGIGPVHGAGHIQHQHGVGGDGGIAHDLRVGGQGRQGHQEVILPQFHRGGELGGDLGQYRLVGPDGTGILRTVKRVAVSVGTQAEISLPAVQGAGVGDHGAAELGRIRDNGKGCRRNHGKQHDQHQDQA